MGPMHSMQQQALPGVDGFMNCSKCHIRKIEDWEIMCDYCYQAGKADEEVKEIDLEEWKGEKEW